MWCMCMPRRKRGRSESAEGQEKRVVKLVAIRLLLILALIGYGVVGALVFIQLEQGNVLKEIYLLLKIQPIRMSVPNNKTGLLELFTTEAPHPTTDSNPNQTGPRSATPTDGWGPSFNDSFSLTSQNNPTPNLSTGTNWSPGKPWSIPSALLFTFSILTTIGYGNTFPKTSGAKIFCIFYGIVGIPLTMLVLADIGKFQAEVILLLYNRIRKLFCGQYWECRIRRFNKRKLTKDENENIANGPSSKPKPIEEIVPHTPLQDATEVPAPLILFSFAAWIGLGCVLLPIWESDLNSFNAAYFTFVSLSTIGFGDLVPLNHAFLGLTMLYLLTGLAMMTMVVEALANYLRTLHYLGRRIPRLSKTKIWFGDHQVLLDALVRGILKEASTSQGRFQMGGVGMDIMLERIIRECENGDFLSGEEAFLLNHLENNFRYPLVIKPFEHDYITEFIEDGRTTIIDEDTPRVLAQLESELMKDGAVEGAEGCSNSARTLWNNSESIPSSARRCCI